MRLRSGQSGRTGRDQAHDTRSGDSILQGAGNSDGSQTLHCRHRRLERRLYIRRARHPADIVPRPRHGSAGKSCGRPVDTPPLVLRTEGELFSVPRCSVTYAINDMNDSCVYSTAFEPYTFQPSNVFCSFYFTVGTDNGPARHADHGGHDARVSGRPFPHAHTAHEETVHVVAVLAVVVDDARGCSPDFSDARF